MEWENFARRIPKYAKKLEKMGIKYHLSTAGYDDETKTTGSFELRPVEALNNLEIKFSLLFEKHPLIISLISRSK